jgi:hypothetical protein
VAPQRWKLAAQRWEVKSSQDEGDLEHALLNSAKTKKWGEELICKMCVVIRERISRRKIIERAAG